DKIDLIAIGELLEKKFYIPCYQRGYRWTEQQVKDLLDDIQGFIDNREKGIYCIQPLVVKGIPKENAIEKIGKMYTNDKTPTVDEIQKELEIEKWEVIDGQQRLTTIKILLSYLELNEKSYELEYQTRSGSKDFLNKISSKNDGKVGDNIDFYHMHKAYTTISKWFEDKEDSKEDSKEDFKQHFKQHFLKTLKSKVQFIWYETKESDPTKVFTRLNIGKIALTDSELIKALFLNESNFKNQNGEAIRLQQIEIANEWDKIEYTLQNDEFWLFIQNDLHYTKPTRIDYIFDLIRQQKKFGDCGDCGNDEHQTFRYFYNYFNENKSSINAEWLRKTWLTIKNYFQIFEEWYNNLEMYHYVGFLVEQKKETIPSLVQLWENKVKQDFTSEIKDKIKEHIKGSSDLTAQYEFDGCRKKTTIRPLLVLHNVQTIINQNNTLVKNKDYKQGVFIKFPFHLLKKESWDVEHIDSNTTNDLSDIEMKKEYLINCYLACNEEMQKKIEEFCQNPELHSFEDIKKELHFSENQLTDEQKNQLMNFTLLDSSTNRSYGNAIFPAKRRIIKGKDMGKYIPMPKFNKKGELVKGDESSASSSFIPICTKQVFMKYYSDEISSFTEYTLTDAKAYLLDINNVLSGAGFIKDQKAEIEKL
ncbi:MAG: DUF262 domain-containing protein, partial [Fibrobacter sp.]|nr:DUF262 domain-containing protein [Fibrobacter sp.]